MNVFEIIKEFLEMRKFNQKRIPFIFLLTVGLMLGVVYRASIRTINNEEYPNEAVVEQVIDGDTVILEQGEKVRYLGINAPELRVWNGNQWIFKPQIFGEEATAYNQKLVEGKRVCLEYDQQKKDKYGRLLAYVKSEGVFVNGELIRKGLALVDIRAPNLKYQKTLLNFQKEAREFGRGIWGEILDYQVSAQEAFKYIGKVGAVEGKITNVYLGSKMLFLNFGRNFEKDFTGIIYKESLNNFFPKNKDPVKYFLKRRVRIYGFIKDINGPAIIICAPTQIDFLK